VEIGRADRVQRRIERLFVNRDDQFHRNVPRGEARVCDESWSARLFPVRGAQTRPAICGSTTTAGEARSSCARIVVASRCVKLAQHLRRTKNDVITMAHFDVFWHSSILPQGITSGYVPLASWRELRRRCMKKRATKFILGLLAVVPMT